MDHYNKWHISYLAQLAHQLHNFDFDFFKKTKEHSNDGMAPKTLVFYNRCILNSPHCYFFYLLNFLYFQSLTASKFMLVTSQTTTIVPMVCHTFEFMQVESCDLIVILPWPPMWVSNFDIDKLNSMSTKP